MAKPYTLGIAGTFPADANAAGGLFFRAASGCR
jgi:hypothetical protein